MKRGSEIGGIVFALDVIMWNLLLSAYQARIDLYTTIKVM